MNLLFAVNRKFTGLLCSCLYSVVRHGGAAHYDAYILHSDLEEADRSRICAAGGEAVRCSFLRVEETIFEGFPETGRYPKQIYYRLLSPLLLPQTLDRILYLDADTVVINPLTDLYDADFEGNYYIACSHVREFLTRFNRVRLGVTGDVPYINTGVMLMNLPLLRANLTVEQIRDTAQKKLHTLMLPDQDLLTVMHGAHIKLTDPMRWNLSDRILSIYNASPQNPSRDVQWVRDNCAVVHYCGRNKPWKDGYLGVLDIFYRENEEAMRQDGISPGRKP